MVLGKAMGCLRAAPDEANESEYTRPWVLTFGVRHLLSSDLVDLRRLSAIERRSSPRMPIHSQVRSASGLIFPILR